jgi:PadR family transcriptional regulator PadR
LLQKNFFWYTYRPMGRRRARQEGGGDMLLGTLDMLVLRTLVFGPAHGHAIAHAIERSSEEVLQVEHGSLYPALHRLEDQGLIASFWGTSENNRKAKYYRLSAAGKRHLVHERSRWEALVLAVRRVLGPATNLDG